MKYRSGYYEWLDEDFQYTSGILLIENDTVYRFGYDVAASITDDEDFAKFRETVIWERRIGRFLFEKSPYEMLANNSLIS